MFPNNVGLGTFKIVILCYNNGKLWFIGSLTFILLYKLNYLRRGDVIYYQMLDSELEKNENLPKMYLVRVVGLPDETVKIENGQVYINDKKLDTFYGVATSLGLTKEEYFETVNLKNVNKEEMENYFNTSMEPIKVEENTVFVLVDMWWRGTDSKDFGLLPEENIICNLL